jgi:hypothetical protein
MSARKGKSGIYVRTEKHRKAISKAVSLQYKNGTKKGGFSKNNKYAWKGGKSITGYGYILIYAPEHPSRNNKGYVREHRLVMERIIGRRLKREEIVHHINENKKDNRPSNLLLFPNVVSHWKHHRMLRKKSHSKLV